MKSIAHKVMLVILDGWGLGKKAACNAVYMAHTPCMDRLCAQFPNAQLRTDGENVGLPDGQMGNSEVGHINLGAGRVVFQDLVSINLAIRNKTFFSNQVLCEAMDQAAVRGCTLHIMGLVSDGGVHSHIDHLTALCTMAQAYPISRVFVHAFTDGRDCDPHSGRSFMATLHEHCQRTGASIASVCGRYYAMDRDNRWDRVAKAYHLLVKGEGTVFPSADAAMAAMYEAGTSDEFITPCVIDNGSENGRIRPGDVVICANFRTDRCREITQVLTQHDNHEFNMHRLDLHYVTMTRYDAAFAGVKVAFEKDNLSETLGETIARRGFSQVRIAETEKYPHVTFFFNGGREEPFPGEQRVMVASPGVATYDQQPEMSAAGVAQAVCKAIAGSEPDFICVNFANADMVGHTGVFSAVVKAVETTDQCLETILAPARALGYDVVVLADHGNADCVVNEDGSPNTAHTTNPVPLVVVSNRVESIADGILADIAPTVLALMGEPVPPVMTGRVLVRFKEGA